MTYHSSFDAALTFVLQQEGEYVDNPKDPGGPTVRGMALRSIVGVKDDNGALVYDLNHDGRVDEDDLKIVNAQYAAGDTQALETFYLERYWIPSRCAELRWPLWFSHFDAAVNHGVGAAAIQLQKAVGTAPDRVIGVQTLRAANRTNSETLPRMLTERAYLYHQLSAARGDTFFKGWLRRLFALQDRIHELEGSVG